MKDISACRQCPRLVKYLQQVKQQYPDYHCRPVPGFGHAPARLLIVGLAPGKHGANASGIPFIGDAAGDLLYKTLFATGFCSHSRPNDAESQFKLFNCGITNAVKCLPPENKPNQDEITRCNRFLGNEINDLKKGGIVLALGQIAHKAILKSLSLRQVDYPFRHAAEYTLNPQLTLIDSYHCSRYNTQTGRLTEVMLLAIFERVKEMIAHDRE